MDLRSATTRLRRTFAYPSETNLTSPFSSHDSDSDDGPPLDEQEQEDLIRTLTAQNATRNAQFRLALLSLPALSTIPYLLLLAEQRGAAADVWVAMLALSSLASTGWMLWAQPAGTTGIRAVDAWVAGRDNDDPRRRGPLERFLPFLNMALCALLVAAGLVSSRWSRQWGHVGLANLPAVVYVVVLVAEMLMGSTDPERELSALRYDYKGA